MSKWGIIGAGAIAEKFASDLRFAKNATLKAVASRDLSKSAAFASTWGGVPYGSYEELLSQPAVEIVYIATPHHNHAEWAIKSMEAGKHVLVEKPAGVGARQVREMISVAKANNVFLMEALWTRFRPAFIEMKKQIEEGALGEVDFISADFFYPLLTSKKQRVLDPSLAGGALLDIGIYPVFLAYALLGKPQAIQAMAHMGETGVDIRTAMTFRYPHAMASLACGFASRSEMRAEVTGTKGRAIITGPWHHAEKVDLLTEEGEKSFSFQTEAHGYVYEIDHCTEMLELGLKESPLWSREDMLNLSILLDEVRKQIGLHYPFE